MAKRPPIPYFNSNYRVTGPYFNKHQERMFVTITHISDGTKTQKTYAKYLMENHLKRFLSKEETVDHIDRNKLNDCIENYRIVSPSEHGKGDAPRVKLVRTSCVWCSTEIVRSGRHMRTQASLGTAGPFCGAVCRGKYGASISHGGDRLPVQKAVESEYYYIDKKI